MVVKTSFFLEMIDKSLKMHYNIIHYTTFGMFQIDSFECQTFMEESDDEKTTYLLFHYAGHLLVFPYWLYTLSGRSGDYAKWLSECHHGIFYDERTL